MKTSNVSLFFSGLLNNYTVNCYFYSFVLENYTATVTEFIFCFNSKFYLLCFNPEY